MTKIILTRHGHVEGIEPERFRGRTDVPLTELGRAQAGAVAARISELWKPLMVYTSPMGRCVATGQEIAKACGAPSKVLEDLNDIDYGQWHWRTRDEVRATAPELFATWQETPQFMRFPGGDSLQDLVARTSDALRFILAQHPAETVVMVGHVSVNRALLLQLLDRPLSAYWKIAQEPCCINEIDLVHRQVSVRRFNEIDHLPKSA